MTSNQLRRGVGIQAKMLAIILPLIAAPMLILAGVGFYTANREEANSNTRYLAQREADLRSLAENPGIRSYFNNAKYGLVEEAEIARQELQVSLVRFIERSNSGGQIYSQARYLDHQGLEVAKAADSKVPNAATDVAAETFFDRVKTLKPDQTYLSPDAPLRVFAIPVHQRREGQPPAFMGAVAIDFAYSLSEFQRTTSVILRTFVFSTAFGMGVALLLTVLRVRQFTNPIRRLSYTPWHPAWS